MNKTLSYLSQCENLFRLILSWYTMHFHLLKQHLHGCVTVILCECCGPVTGSAVVKSCLVQHYASVHFCVSGLDCLLSNLSCSVYLPQKISPDL